MQVAKRVKWDNLQEKVASNGVVMVRKKGKIKRKSTLERVDQSIKRKEQELHEIIAYLDYSFERACTM